mmetsp:Transcript_18855/g.30944  ORF Transcript_18855/g.30944 Transcript_18855/m.30944 type:complete len:317 (+) Transcript_18855:474-1424(+)
MLASKCVGLEELRLTRCLKLSDRCLFDVADNCSRLRLLHIRGCRDISDRGVSVVVRKCQQLRDLDISKCPLLTTGCLWEMIPALKSKGPARDWEDISSPDIDDADIVRGCPHMTRLSMAGVVRLDDQIISRLVGLEYLDLSDCFKVGNTGIQRAVRGCPQLHSLYLRGCKEVTDASVKTIAMQLKQLTELDLSWCQITDASLKYLCNTVRLRSLSMAYCQKISSRATSAMAPHLTSLKFLNLAECSNIDDTALRSLLSQCPSLKTIIAIGTQVTPLLTSKYPSVEFIGTGWQLEEEQRRTSRELMAADKSWLRFAV